MSEDRFKSQGCRKQHILEWKSNLAPSAPMGTAQRYFSLSEQAMLKVTQSRRLWGCWILGVGFSETLTATEGPSSSSS